MGGDWRPAGPGHEAACTQRAGTKRKSRICRLAGRRAGTRGERRPLPRSMGGPRQRRRAARGDLNHRCFEYQSAVLADSERETRSRCNRRRCGVRAQLCLAGAPPRQARRVRSAVRTMLRSLSAPAAGSERPSATALLRLGASRGRQAPADGVRPDAAGRQGKAFPSPAYFKQTFPTASGQARTNREQWLENFRIGAKRWKSKRGVFAGSASLVGA